MLSPSMGGFALLPHAEDARSARDWMSARTRSPAAYGEPISARKCATSSASARMLSARASAASFLGSPFSRSSSSSSSVCSRAPAFLAARSASIESILLPRLSRASRRRSNFSPASASALMAAAASAAFLASLAFTASSISLARSVSVGILLFPLLLFVFCYFHARLAVARPDSLCTQRDVVDQHRVRLDQAGLPVNLDPRERTARRKPHCG